MCRIAISFILDLIDLSMISDFAGGITDNNCWGIVNDTESRIILIDSKIPFKIVFRSKE